MNKKPFANHKALPRLETSNKAKSCHLSDSFQSAPVQPLSCPTIKGVVGEAMSYYKGKIASKNISQIHIFSLSFQTQLAKGFLPASQEANVIRKDGQNLNRYANLGRSQSNGLKDTSYLLGKFAYQAGKGVRVRNLRQAYLDIERVNRSQRVRNQTIKKDSSALSKSKKKQQNPEEEKTFFQNTLIIEASELQLPDEKEQQMSKQGLKPLKWMSKSPSKVQTGIYRLYATKTNLLGQTSNQIKKAKLINCSLTKTRVHKFSLGPGNNSELVKSILEARGNWIPSTQRDTLYNLKWQQSIDKNFYLRQEYSRFRQFANHIPAHQKITTKRGLLETLKHFFQRQNAALNLRPDQSVQCFDLLPVTFAFDGQDKTQFEQQLKRFVFYYCENHPNQQRALRMDRDYIELIKEVNPEQKVRTLNLTMNKNHLMRKFSIPPLSDIYKSSESQYFWIFKPSELNRGRGIQIFSSLEQLAAILKDKALLSGDFVIQKYIEKPLLLRGRKFDIRVWVLVDCQGQAYFFEEGYIRTSSQSFDLSSTEKNNQYVHLTNNAVQKHCSNYGLHEDGNQLSFLQFDQFVNKAPGYFSEHFLPKIKNICGLVMEAGTKASMLGEKRLKKIDKSIRIQQKPSLETFQIFGFDYMIDANERLWLIEVNTNPCLETSSQLLESLIPRMLDNALQIVIDPIFQPSQTVSYPVSGYTNSENMWKPLNRAEDELSPIRLLGDKVVLQPMSSSGIL